MTWAACGLFPLLCSCQNNWLSLRCKDFSGFFELIVLRYVKWIFLLSITVSLYWAENWKLSLTLILLFFSSMCSNKFQQRVVNLGRRWTFNFLVFHTISFNVAEKSVHISRRLLVCVCTFLLIGKIVYGLLAFGNACFSFCIKSFQMFRIILTSLGQKCSSSSSIFDFSKISIFLAFSDSFAMKNENIQIFSPLFWLQILNLLALLQNKNTQLGPIPWKWSLLQKPDWKRTNQSARICLRLASVYNNQ